MVDTGVTIFFVKMQNSFGIAVCCISVTAFFQHSAEFEMVVDFSVEDNPDCPVLVGHRLVSTSHVNNTETPEAHRDWAVVQLASIVGSTVMKDSRHGFQILPSNLATGQAENPIYATHVLAHPCEN